MACVCPWLVAGIHSAETWISSTKAFPMAPSPFVINVTKTTFDHDVVQKSMETPVVIDFWAPWCNPCRQLAPILEALANEMGGKFILAKVNTDEEPEIAQAFRVES